LVWYLIDRGRGAILCYVGGAGVRPRGGAFRGLVELSLLGDAGCIWHDARTARLGGRGGQFLRGESVGGWWGQD